MIGKVYKLTNEKCDKCYIGSTKSKYMSIRMAHHRERHNKQRHNYRGLFTDGDPKVEILEEVEFELGEDWKLRAAEQKWADLNRDYIINIRRCYVSPRSRKIDRDIRINKYHKSEKGKLALRKGAINHRLKNTAKPVTGLKRSELKKELERINIRQAELRIEKIDEPTPALAEEQPEFPLPVPQDQSA
tara:strand:+ start:264 stop:827 length:564 start_codon:yes stop_codon:yes gene_type:complete